MVEFIKEKRMIIIISIVIVVLGLFSFFNRDSKESDVQDIEIEEVMVDKSEKENGMIVIDVKGEVISPGIYEMKQGERVNDVIKRAGGLTSEADIMTVNLAELLSDEKVVYVAKKVSIDVEAVDASSNSGGNSGSKINGKLRINYATESDLLELPGIGPSKAKSIITYREANGSFKKVEDLLNVKGIGEKSLEDLKEVVTVN